jgi:AraC-like DNA-binding protein
MRWAPSNDAATWVEHFWSVSWDLRGRERFDPTVDSADLAVRLGWYDQAHFINDFRTMLGCTPGEYATRHG